MLNELKFRVRSIPPFTRYYLFGIIAVSLLLSLDILLKVNIFSYLYLNFNKVLYKLQIWRLATNFFINGTFSLGLIFHLMLVNFSLNRLESEAKQKKKYDDFAMMITFLVLSCLVFGYISEVYYLSNELLMSIVYIECKLHADEIKSIWGFQIKSEYVPYIFVLLNIAFKQDFTSNIIGIVLGYSYYFIKFRLVEKYGKDIYPTPKFM